MEPNFKKAEQLRKVANGLQSKINKKRATFQGANITHRRARMQQQAFAEADRMEQAQTLLQAAANLFEKGEAPAFIDGLRYQKTAISLVEDVRFLAEYGRLYNKDKESGYFDNGQYEAAVEWAGQTLDGLREAQREARELEDLQRKARLSNITSFFWTPRIVVEEMLGLVPELNYGGRFLEPSAGDGAILDIVKERFGHVEDLVIDAGEIVPMLRRILELKGYNLVSTDFLEYEPGEVYDAILQNPPFEKMADVDHVRHAYSLLKPGGTLVSIMSPGPFFRNDQKAKDFRSWFEEVGGEEYKDLEAGTFSEAGTNVTSKIVVIMK